MRKQIRVDLSEETIEAIKTAATKKGISSGILIRMILHEQFSRFNNNAESKAYTITAKDWREIEAYVEAKRFGSVEVFVGFAMKQYMTKYPLTEGHKRQNDKNIGDADTRV